MAVGGVKGGGRSSGGRSVGGAGKATGGTTFKVQGNERAGGTSTAAGPSRAAGTSEASAITVGAAEIARGLRDGTIGSKSEATRKLVSLILQDKKLLDDKKGTRKLIQQIADTLQQDPRLAAALERTWARSSGD